MKRWVNQYIDTENFSRLLRNKCVKLSEKKVLITKFSNSKKGENILSNINCSGFGRIRSFEKYTLHLRTLNTICSTVKPLLRGHPQVKKLRSQVFQIAACNWRCWYCFLENEQISANMRHAKFYSTEELIDLYLHEDNRPDVIDLSGGQPDLVPEWCLWMMETMMRKDLAGKVYLWADDNLSTRIFWDTLSVEQIDFMLGFPKYSKVGCFKGCDRESFVFNTRARPDKFDEQFIIFRNFLQIGFDMYAYATFVLPPDIDVPLVMKEFVDRLQNVNKNLPLRTIPLRIYPFPSVRERITKFKADLYWEALNTQLEAFNAWETELSARYTREEIELPYDDVKLD